MGRTAKIALAGTLGGLLMALTIGLAMREAPRVEIIDVPADEGAIELPDHDPGYCRTLTVPDSACEAVWEERRRRFHRKDDRP